MLIFRSYLKVRQPELCYIPIEDEAARHLIRPQDKFFNGAITLHDDQGEFFGFETAEFEIWRQFINALQDWQKSGAAHVRFHDSRYEMTWTPLGADQLQFALHHPGREPVVKVFPRAAFLDFIVGGLLAFFEKVIEYGNAVERNHNTVWYLQELRETL